MVLTKTLTYDVLNVDGKPKANSRISVSWKSAETGAKHLIHKAFVIQSAQRRQGTASCKTRTEVEGGGKKPWKQKGTGRARSGSSNSPLWRGGGVAFGPKPKKFDKKINFKEKRLALSTALCSTANKTVVIDDLFTCMESPSTKGLRNKLKSLGVGDDSVRTLLITDEINPNFNLSIRNIPNCQLFDPRTLNLKEVLLAQKILITEKALSKLNQI